MKVMIIESDWPFEAKATEYFESHADLVVHEIPAGAVDHARSWGPDLLILAAEYATEGLLDSMGKLEPAPAVLLTEHMSRFDRAWSAWQLGGDELLMKPIFHLHELRQASITAMENATVCPSWNQRGTTAISA